MKLWNRLLPLVMGLTLVGCSAQEMSAFGIDRCQNMTPEGCLDSQDDACELKSLLADLCTDEDDDCFYSECRADAPKWVISELLDCNDQNPDIHPFITERCDGRDENCNGAIDEGFRVGQPCTQCGGGVLECSVQDPFQVVCSSLPGQSSNVWSDVIEICDGQDDDCDGQVDERCRLNAPEGTVFEQVALCDDQLYALQDDNITRQRIDEYEAPEVLKSSVTHGRHLSCGVGGLAWLEAETCFEVLNEPSRCTGTVWIRPTEGAPRAVTGLGSYGAPIVTNGAIYFHSIVEGTPYINRHTFDDEPPQVVMSNASDPTPPNENSEIIVRSWDEGERPRIKLRSIDDPGREAVVGNPRSGAFAPVANDRWVVWITGEQQRKVWAVPVSDLSNGGFVAVAINSGRLESVKIIGDTIFFINRGTAQTDLESFNLKSGRQTIISSGELPGDAYSVQPNHIAWIQEEDSTTSLRVFSGPTEDLSE